MKAVYLDCFAGISGNMLLGAFLQLGVPQKHLEQELHKLITGDEFELHVSDVMKNGIQAKYVDVEVKGGDFNSVKDQFPGAVNLYFKFFLRPVAAGKMNLCGTLNIDGSDERSLDKDLVQGGTYVHVIFGGDDKITAFELVVQIIEYFLIGRDGHIEFI